jgi:DnaK suppressor protein
MVTSKKSASMAGKAKGNPTTPATKKAAVSTVKSKTKPVLAKAKLASSAKLPAKLPAKAPAKSTGKRQTPPITAKIASPNPRKSSVKTAVVAKVPLKNKQVSSPAKTVKAIPLKSAAQLPKGKSPIKTTPKPDTKKSIQKAATTSPKKASTVAPRKVAVTLASTKKKAVLPASTKKSNPLEVVTVKAKAEPKPASKSSPSPMQAIKPSSIKNPSTAATKPTPTTDAPKQRSSRSKGIESSPAPIVLVSTAAKASFGTFTPAIAPTHPTPNIVKKDPLLANNWKTKPVETLSDAEIMAMPDSEYMNSVQMAFFRNKLIALKREILESASETADHLRDESSVVPDPTDRATIEEEHALELRTRDRERKLLKKIDQSISSIDAGDYGYCDETGEPIGTGRLLARPTATLSLEAQQRRELKQKLFGD